MHGLKRRVRHLYLHGFASSANSKKGVHLAAALAARGVSLRRLDLNVPSFADLSPHAALGIVEAAADDAPITLYGSSLGGWFASILASRHPGQVRRLVLLCPGFDLATRWPALLGPEGLARWEQEGTWPFDDAYGVPTPVHWRFVEEARTLPPWPQVSCPTLVIHGRRDDIVPYASSERWVAAHPNARLVGFDDDHALLASLDALTREILTFVCG